MTESKGWYKASITGKTATTGGAILALANPEGVDLAITDLLLNVTTKSTGAANVDAGIAANATTSSDTLLDGQAVGAVATKNNHDDGGTNGQHMVVWGADEYLTITGSADTTGLVADVYVGYRRL